MADRLGDAQGADDQEPYDHHRPEQPPHRRRAPPLDAGETDDDHHRDRDDQILQFRFDDPHAFHRGEYRDGGGDHAVAEEQRGAEDPDPGEETGRPRCGTGPEAAQQRDQRHDAAFPVVVRAHHQRDVGEGDDDHHRPEDQRYDPVHIAGGERDGVRVLGIEHGLDGVDRAGADIPEHHPERADRYRCPQRDPAGSVRGDGLWLIDHEFAPRRPGRSLSCTAGHERWPRLSGGVARRDPAPSSRGHGAAVGGMVSSPLLVSAVRMFDRPGGRCCGPVL